MASSLATIATDLAIPDEAKALLQEAMADFEHSEHDQAKKLIQGRLREIKRLEACLEKAKVDLAKLLNRSVDEMLILED
jgi:isochorismate hydrolase